MKKTDKIQSLIEQIKDIEKIFNISNENKETEKSKVDDFSIMKYIEINEVSIIDTDIKIGSINYISENIEKNLGLKKKDLIDEGIYYFFKHLIPHHIEYLKITLSLITQAFTTWNPLELKNMRLTIVGLRIQCNQSQSIGFLNNVQHDYLDNSNIPHRAIFMLQNITHLLKNDDYWIRISCTHNPKRVIAYHSNSNLKLKGDILSKRESEILKLIVKGKNADEIGKELFISRITVNNHRQNILDKFCAKDTTALIILVNATGFLFNN